MANTDSTKLSPRLSPCVGENRSSPEHGSPRNNNEQSLHILVEPLPDGQMNLIHLVNPLTGQVFSSLYARNGTCLEIQPGVLFRVPFPEEHGYRSYPPQQQFQQPAYPSNIVPCAVQVPTGGMYMPRGGGAEFVNPHCPVHGPIIQQMNNSHNPIVEDNRLEKRREKLQKKLREQQPHCDCHHYEQSQVLGPKFTPRRDGNKMNGPVINDQENGESNEVDGKEFDDGIPVLAAPEVEAKDAMSAKISWEATVANNIHQSDCLFELEMASKGTAFKSIYSGKKLEYTANGLTPGASYDFRLHVIIEEKHGKHSEVATVQLPCAIPSAPNLPKVTQKTKTSLLIRWSAPNDGGSAITTYSLEWNHGKPKSQFEEVYNGLQRQYKLSHKLPPSTLCKFRLRASNEVGWSDFSQILECMTNACPPEMPNEPKLVKKTSTSIALKWIEPTDNGAPITEYRLEMDDEKAGYGFKPVYCGENREYTCNGLRRDTVYRFRLFASNISGSSKPSPITSFKTLPEAPGKIDKPRLSGKAKTHSFTVAWEPPKDTGGPEISDYVLEICDTKDGDFIEVFRGQKTESIVTGLIPGRTYKLRVFGMGSGGKSLPSPMAQITTLPVCPCKASPPKLSTKHKQEPASIHLEWASPSEDGGSPIVNYLVRMRGLAEQDEDFRDIYDGPKRQCSINGLQPGERYLFKLQATNRAGASPWSDVSELSTAPGPPDAPKDLLSVCKSPTHIRLDWIEPQTHGSPVTGYTVEQLQNEVFVKVYEGSASYCEIKKKLSPATFYYFRAQALSSAGASSFSSVCSIETLPASPSSVSVVKVLNQTSGSAFLQWKHPNNNGAAILHYVLEVTGTTTSTVTVPLTITTTTPSTSVSDVDELSLDGDNSSLNTSQEDDRPRQTSDVMEYDVTGLLADTAYRIRVQAVNRIGSGPFSHPVQFLTKELPPSPPSLELISSSYQSLKLKWGESVSPRRNNLGLHFTLQLRNQSNSYNDIFTGMGQSFSVSKLKELTPYTFRINARNDAGDGEFSQPATFYTKAQPPPVIKDLSWKKLNLSSAMLSWHRVDPIKNDDEINYIVQRLTLPESKDFSEVYKGNETETMFTDLMPDHDYQVRVCALRKLSDSTRASASAAPMSVKGSFSPILRMRITSDKAPDTSMQTSSEKGADDVTVKEITDSQVTFLILGVFLLIGLIFALALWFFMGEIKF
eukprot:gene11063-12231_t